MLTCLIVPQEHVNGRTIVGRADPGDRAPLAAKEFGMVPAANEPADPLRSSQFNDYVTDTGVIGNGYSGNGTPFTNDSAQSLAYFINPYAKHGQRDYFNENLETPTGKPGTIADVRGRILDGRTQFPGQSRFRYNTNIPRPAYMSFSDLLDIEGVQ